MDHKKLPRKSFNTTRSISYLETQLNNIEQHFNKSITAYASRLQKAYIINYNIELLYRATT